MTQTQVTHTDKFYRLIVATLLMFQADDGSQQTRGEVIVNFVGVNHPPTFPNCNQYRDVTIQEGMPLRTSIINVSDGTNV